MSENTDRSLFGNLRGSLSLVQNFYIEFFGTLVPGIVAVLCVFFLMLGFCYFILHDGDLVREVIRLSFSTVGGMTFFLMIAYVTGAIVYRITPKTPDTISSHRQWRLTKNGSARDEVGRLSVVFDPDRAIPHGLLERLKFWIDREHWILRKAGSSIDYPYPLMRKYLCCRGLRHLADYVPWCAGSGGSAFKEDFQKGVCSKTYVNIIKQRLRSSGHINLILDMVRNECHIRMLCSLWYIFTFVFRMLLLSFLVALTVAFLQVDAKDTGESRRKMTFSVVTNVSEEVVFKIPFKKVLTVEQTRHGDGKEPKDSNLRRDIFCFSLLIVASVLVFYCRRSIEQGIHYVRTREVVMILESAWIMDNVDYGDQPGIRLQSCAALFCDFRKQADQFCKSHCRSDVCKFWKMCYG